MSKGIIRRKKNVSRMFTRFLAEYLSAEARSIFMTVERLFLSRGTLCVCVDREEKDGRTNKEREREYSRTCPTHALRQISINTVEAREYIYAPTSSRVRNSRERRLIPFGGCGHLKNDTS